MSDELSIVIPLFNSQPTLPHLIQGLKSQEDSRFEAVLVDDCSTDNTFSVARELTRQDPRFCFIKTERHYGSGGARNRGVQCARHSLILFLDADTLPYPNIVAAVKKAFQDDPECQAMTGISSPLPLKKGAFARFLALLDHYDAVSKKRESVTLFDPRVGAIRKGFFEKMGGFTETFKTASVEDYEFSRRISQHAQIRLNGELVVRHRFPGAWRCLSNNIRRGFHWGRLFGRYRQFDNLGNATPLGAVMTAVSLLFGLSPLLMIVDLKVSLAVMVLCFFAVLLVYRKFLYFSLEKTRNIFHVIVYPLYLIMFFAACGAGVLSGLFSAAVSNLFKRELENQVRHA